MADPPLNGKPMKLSKHGSEVIGWFLCNVMTAFDFFEQGCVHLTRYLNIGN